MEGTNFYETLYKKDLDCANSGDLSTILGPNNKSFRSFHPWTPLRDFRVIGWLARWIRVSPTFYFQKLASLQYSWSLITLNRRLRFFKIYRHDKNVTVDEVTETIKKECEGPGQLLGYLAMYHEIRQVHGLNVTRDLVYSAMKDVHPEGLENRKPILKKKKTKSTISSVGTNWVLSMDEHDKLMRYQNSTFPLTVCGYMDTASRKLLFIWAWTSNSNPVYPKRWYFEYLCESKTLPYHIRIDKGSETTIMGTMQAFSWLWFTGFFHLSKFSFEDALYFLTTHVFPLKLSSSLLALYAIRKPIFPTLFWKLKKLP